MDAIETSVRENIRQFGMIAPGSAVLVGFSGGPDSTALVQMLHNCACDLHFALAACYINHGIRRNAVAGEIAYCTAICKKLNIPLTVVEADIPAYAKTDKLSLEQAGRNFRIDALNEIAKREKCNVIALGHHLDDQIETILFRLFRGTGPNGILPIKPVSGNIIRPLYNILRSEIEAYCKRHKLNPVLDESNLQSHFSRNYIRNKIIPVIETHFEGKYRNALVHFAQIVSDENDYLECRTQRELKKIAQFTPGGKIIVDLAKIAAYDLWLRRRLIKTCLERLDGQVGAGSFEQIGRIDEIIVGRKKAVSLPNAIRTVVDRGCLYFVYGTVRWKTHRLDCERAVDLPEIRSRMKCRRRSGSKAVTIRQKQGYRIHLDADKITPPLSVRGIRTGDKFCPLGMRGTKKIGDYLTDARVSRLIRDEIPVVTDGSGIIWLVGYQIAERVKIEKETTNILEIELSERRRHGKSQI
ncbi:MAG: tRNA lysidine(34) synthetase TilS [candidate division Zixibacteria bacterium]|nr:tRNA lysidine(34) synthetase TilS [candidate division Zixibacteria bacterium]